MRRRVEVKRVRSTLHNTGSQQGSMWEARQSWEKGICQSECMWPGLVVHLSQHSRRFLHPCVERDTKTTISWVWCPLSKPENCNRVSRGSLISFYWMICVFIALVYAKTTKDQIQADINRYCLFVFHWMQLFSHTAFCSVVILWPGGQACWAFWQ